MRAKLLSLVLACIFMGCSKNESNPPEQPTNIKLSKIDITNAAALYVTDGGSSSRATNSGSNLFKINDSGAVQKVSFIDEERNEVDFEVVNVIKISEQLVIILAKNIYNDPLLSSPSYLYDHAWIVRKSDGAVFDLGSEAQTILQNFRNQPSTLLVDRSGNIYWVDFTDIFSPGPLYKMSPFSSDNLTATAISGDFKTIGWCYIDNQDVILMSADYEGIYRFPDGTFVKDEKVYFNDRTKGIYLMPIKLSPLGGFISLEEGNPGTVISTLIPDKSSYSITRTEVAKTGIARTSYQRDDLADGGYVLYTSNYKDYIYVSPSGDVEVKSYETGFGYSKKTLSNNCVYGIGGGSIYRMNFDTRVTEQVFSNGNYRIDSYTVSPDDAYIDIFALRYSDARKVVLRVRDGAVVSEEPQSEETGDVITFIRLN